MTGTPSLTKMRLCDITPLSCEMHVLTTESTRFALSEPDLLLKLKGKTAHRIKELAEVERHSTFSGTNRYRFRFTFTAI